MKFMLYARTRGHQFPSALLCGMTIYKYYLIICHYQVQKKRVYKHSLVHHVFKLVNKTYVGDNKVTQNYEVILYVHLGMETIISGKVDMEISFKMIL